MSRTLYIPENLMKYETAIRFTALQYRIGDYPFDKPIVSNKWLREPFDEAKFEQKLLDEYPIAGFKQIQTNTRTIQLRFPENINVNAPYIKLVLCSKLCNKLCEHDPNIVGIDVNIQCTKKIADLVVRLVDNYQTNEENVRQAITNIDEYQMLINVLNYLGLEFKESM